MSDESGESGESCDQAYASVDAYRAAIGKEDTGDAAAICRDLTAASRMIDRTCGTFFLQSENSETRKYRIRGNGGRMWMIGCFLGWDRTTIAVDPIADPEVTVTVDGKERTDFELRPYNVEFGPEPRPWTQIYSKAGFWESALVEVDAIFGWPEIPTGITAACIQLTAIWRLESPRATTRIAEGMSAVIGTSEQAQSIVDRLVAQYGPQIMVG